jgi:hypothetical protein
MLAVSGSTKKRRIRIALRIVAWVTRIIVTLVAMQLSGLGHVAMDLLVAAHTVVDGADCPNEKPGRDCPPGCPGCHCAHGGIAVPPSSLKTAALPILGEGGRVHVRPSEADAPSEALLPSIFRPPRRNSLT